ncbi:MAG: hypothetical protein AAF004_13210 [Pseudomonadota bacterium]
MDGSQVKVYVLPVLAKAGMAMQVRNNQETVAPAYLDPMATLLAQAILAKPDKSLRRPSQQFEAILDRKTADMDFAQHFGEIIPNTVDAGRVRVTGVDPVASEVDTATKIYELFDSQNIDYVIILYGSYAMGPGGHQLDISIKQHVYETPTFRRRAGPLPSHKRRFHYQSPHRDLWVRDFEKGEQSAYRESATAEFNALAEENPKHARQLRKQLKRELKLIDELTEISVNTAFDETWIPDLFDLYLNEAADHLNFMLSYDWADHGRDTLDGSAAQSFFALGKGNLKGIPVRVDNVNKVYRVQTGDMYSVY